MRKLMIPILLLVSSNVLAAGAVCTNSKSTSDEIKCLQNKVNEAESAMARYLDASKKRYASGRQPSIPVQPWELREDLWLDYRDRRCNTLGLYPGSEAGIAARYLYCRYWIAREQTHRLWEKFLKHADGTAEDFPEPEVPPENPSPDTRPPAVRIHNEPGSSGSHA